MAAVVQRVARYTEGGMDLQEYWERVYASKRPDEVSWFRLHLETSLALIERARLPLSAAILDVGAGASTLIDDLLARGYHNITALDVSHSALDVARRRLGAASQKICWIEADITRAEMPVQAFDIWHDRAVFHFLTSREERQEYVRMAVAAIKPGGRLIIATFGAAGPSKCSGLDVVRYDAAGLARELGGRFRLTDSFEELHRTPAGTTQQFLYCDFVLED